MSKYENDKRSPFDDKDETPNLQQATNEIYGLTTDLPESGRVVAKPLDIFKIWPDRKQPRRAIPFVIQGQWDGNPATVPDLLQVWWEAAEKAIGQQINIKRTMNGLGDGIDFKGDELPGITRSYLELLSLASSIYRDGLIEPITVVKQGQAWQIVAGERRWLAHHLIHDVMNDKGRVLAIEKQQFSIWEQAAENGARNPLNAIGTARQLALLIMDLREGTDGVKFYDYDTMILPGECDRKFYAQAQAHNIPRGMSQKVLDAMGFTSSRVIWDYRKLWTVSDEIWIQADAESWSKTKILEELDKQEGTNRTGINTPEIPENPEITYRTGSLSPENTGRSPFQRESEHYRTRDEIEASNTRPGAQSLDEWKKETNWENPLKKAEATPRQTETEQGADKPASQASPKRHDVNLFNRHEGGLFLKLIRDIDAGAYGGKITEIIDSLEAMSDEELEQYRVEDPKKLRDQLERQYQVIGEWFNHRIDEVNKFFNAALSDE